MSLHNKLRLRKTFILYFGIYSISLWKAVLQFITQQAGRYLFDFKKQQIVLYLIIICRRTDELYFLHRENMKFKKELFLRFKSAI